MQQAESLSEKSDGQRSDAASLPDVDLQRFWQLDPRIAEMEFPIEPPQRPLELLEKLGPSPFERGTFPLIGFLATTYDKVSRYALGRRGGGS